MTTSTITTTTVVITTDHCLGRGRKSLAKIFAQALYPRMLEELADLELLENFREPVLIPIPLAPKRLRERGFNQAELLCKELLKLDKSNGILAMANNVLAKPKDTIHQAHATNRTARLKNLIGSFVVNNQELIENKNIILIDDITTTGATLSEARKILKQAGARKVIAFTVAH